MHIYALIPLIAVIAYLVLIGVIATRPLARVQKVFIWLLAVSAVWSFTSFVLHAEFFPTQSLPWHRALLVLALSVPIIFYHFIRVYFNKSAGKLMYLGYVGLIGMAVFVSLGGILKSSYVVDGILYWEYDASFYPFMLFMGVFMGMAYFYLVQGFKSSTDPHERNRIVYLVTAISVWILFASTNLVPALANYSVDHIGNIAFALIISYTILRYQLLNIRLVARRTLTYFVLGGALLGISTGAVLIGLRFLPAQPAPTIILFTTLLAIVIFLMARPLRHFIQEGIDRLFYRRTYEHRQALLSFSSKMGGILNLDELAKEMLPTMTRALSITQTSLLLQDVGSGDFVAQFTHPKTNSE